MKNDRDDDFEENALILAQLLIIAVMVFGVLAVWAVFG